MLPASTADSFAAPVRELPYSRKVILNVPGNYRFRFRGGPGLLDSLPA